MLHTRVEDHRSCGIAAEIIEERSAVRGRKGRGGSLLAQLKVVLLEPAVQRAIYRKPHIPAHLHVASKPWIFECHGQGAVLVYVRLDFLEDPHGDERSECSNDQLKISTRPFCQLFG